MNMSNLSTTNLELEALLTWAKNADVSVHPDELQRMAEDEIAPVWDRETDTWVKPGLEERIEELKSIHL